MNEETTLPPEIVSDPVAEPVTEPVQTEAVASDLLDLTEDDKFYIGK